MGHRNLSKLGKDVQDRIKRLEFGELKASELDELVEDARDLYDRLTVLRYRYYDEKVKAKKKKENLKGEIPLLFKMEGDAEANEEKDIPNNPEISPNQTSLIDAIEEIQTEDVSEPVQEEKSEPKETKKEAKKPKVETPKVEELNFDQEVPVSTDEEESLVEKMERAPITNLKKEIALNQKFRFINELFDGKADEYNSLINQIDSASDLDAAMKLVNEQGRSKYSWNEEIEEVEQFTDLVERRFL